MLILVRYGEIGLKSSPVRKKFEERLVKRLEEKLSYLEIEGEILRSEGRIFADVAEEDAADAALGLSRVPGVVSVSPVVKTSLELGVIGEKAVELLEKREGTFAVDARRAGEHDYTSKEIEEYVGQQVVDYLRLEVDLDEPSVTVHVEARYQNAYLHTETVKGVGGLPVNDENSVAVLMEDSTNPENSLDRVNTPSSSSQASTVAAFLLMKRGCKVFPVYTGREQEKLVEDMNALRQFDPGIKLTVMKGKEAGEALGETCELYRCRAAALPLISGELDVDLPRLDAETLLPNAGMSEDEVLETYGKLLVPP